MKSKNDDQWDNPIECMPLSKQDVYIIGASGGPDSMALFDICRTQGIQMIAAHMNYQKRDSAQRDEDIVKAYCLQYDIPCEIRKQNKECEGNFQAFAREERYLFYQELCIQYKAKGVLLAHHLDDHLETYLMQKERKSLGEYIGINVETTIYDCHVIRPLLSYTKDELLTYCKEHGVSYGLDESNFSNDYTRNRIRHEIIEHMSHEEKREMASTIKVENVELKERQDACDKFLATWNGDSSALLKLDSELQRYVLGTWIYRTCKERISHHEEKLIQSLLTQKSKQWTRYIKNKYSIYNEYGKICIDDIGDISYSYTLPSITYMETAFFHIQKQGKSTEALTLYERDFPITIRNAKEGDYINLRFGKKKINRWFIDRKIPRKDRKRWPVVTNVNGNIILVPEIGCDIEHFSNNPTIFVVK